MRSQLVFVTGMILILAVAACTSGCSVIPEPQPEIKIVGNSLCSLKKRSWSVDDTRESIEEAIKFNNGWERACGGKDKDRVS